MEKVYVNLYIGKIDIIILKATKSRSDSKWFEDFVGSGGSSITYYGEDDWTFYDVGFKIGWLHVVVPFTYLFATNKPISDQAQEIKKLGSPILEGSWYYKVYKHKEEEGIW